MATPDGRAPPLPGAPVDPSSGEKAASSRNEARPATDPSLPGPPVLKPDPSRRAVDLPTEPPGQASEPAKRAAPPRRPTSGLVPSRDSGTSVLDESEEFTDQVPKVPMAPKRPTGLIPAQRAAPPVVLPKAPAA